MAVRNDITVDFQASPRIITIAAPSTEVIVRDLQDTLRMIEMSDEGMLYPKLRSCEGNADLGSGVYVDLTLTLLNAKLAFQARPGPDWVLCKIVGGNIVAKDVNGAAMEARQPTAYVSVDRALSSSGTLVTGGGGGGGLTATQDTKLMSIPTNPVLATDTRLDKLDVNVSTRLSAASYVAPDNAGVAAIKAKTDNLPADPASNTQVSTRLATSGYTAPDNAGVAAIKAKTDNLPVSPASEASLQSLQLAVDAIFAIATDLSDEAFGKWTVDFAANTMTLYRPDNSVLRVFALGRTTLQAPTYISRTPV